MNPVDWIIVVLAVASMVNGIRQGAAVQVLGFGGFAVGLVIGSFLAPRIAGAFAGGVAKAFASMIVVFGTASLAGALGRTVGVRIWGRLKKLKLGALDATAGAGIALVATLLGVWLVAGMLASVPVLGVASGINQSRVVKALSDVMPPAPALISKIRKLLGVVKFPDVFAEYEPGAPKEVALPSDPDVRAAATAARDATVKIHGFGCGGISNGSGFVAADGLVVTNAHVVAGIDRILVEDRRGRRTSTPLHFDPDLDIAVLRVGNTSPPLELQPQVSPRGSGGAVVGYPKGGPFTAVGASVLDEFRAIGRDIYGRDLVSRDVYQLSADVQPGNSGGPFVRKDGAVVGVIFSASVTQSDVGYALLARDVRQALSLASRASGPADTQQCVN